MKTQKDRRELRCSIILILAPLLFIALTLVQRFTYLKGIDGVLRLVSGIGVLMLLTVFLTRLRGDAIRASLEAMPIRRLSIQLFALAFLVYLLYASGLIFPALPFTGDEPHYLLITRSLTADRDLNLAGDYRDKKYQSFYDGILEPHAFPGKKGDAFLYSKHFPALPVLVVPFYMAGERVGALVSSLTHQAVGERSVLVFFSRLPICLLTALVGLVFFLLAWELTRKRGAALMAWLLFSFCSPVLFYSHLIYPEIPVALILVWIAYLLIRNKQTTARTLFWAGAGIGLIPWFGIKYVPLAGAAFLIVLLVITKSEDRIRAKKAAFFGAPAVVSAGLLILFLLSQYGRISPQVVYKGTVEGAALPLSRFLVGDLADFFGRLLGYWLDQRIGILVYAPFYVLSLAGFFLLRKRRPGQAWLLAGLFTVFWVFCSLTRYWGGFCPPGRPLVPVIWIPALFLGWAFADGRNKAALVIRKTLVVLSFIVVFVALRNPRLLYQESLSALPGPSQYEISSRLLESLNGLLFDWTKLVPTLSTASREQKTWGVAVLWVIAILMITMILVWPGKAGRGQPARLGLKGYLGLVIFLGLAFVALSFFDARIKDGFKANGGAGEVYPQDRNCLGPELDGFWVRGESRALLIIRTDRPVSEVAVSLRSPVEGEATVRLGRKKQRVRRPFRDTEEHALLFSSPRPFRWKGSYLYSLQVEEKGGFYPYIIDINSKDRRFLGVFIKIKIRDTTSISEFYQRSLGPIS